MFVTDLTEPPRPVGIAWYRAQDYDRILKIMTDGPQLPSTYHEWREKSEQLESDLKRLGHTVLRAIVDPEIFPMWCGARGLKVDADARTKFSNELADRHSESNLTLRATAWVSGAEATTTARGRLIDVLKTEASHSSQAVAHSRQDYVADLVSRLLGIPDRIP